jgi:CRISPR/Cas system CSM-associated protein Csm3 (group 7 of RAMP superfamily)
MVTFRYQIRCETGLHIGAGSSIDLAGSNLPVVRNASGAPFIPGSSLRGVLRSGVESICSSLDLNRARPKTSEAGAGVPEKLAEMWNGLTLEQRLFGMVPQSGGAQAYGSRMQISDARCTSSEVAVELRDGVAIARETRTASGSTSMQTSNASEQRSMPSGLTFSCSTRW